MDISSIVNIFSTLFFSAAEDEDHAGNCCTKTKVLKFRFVSLVNLALVPLSRTLIFLAAIIIFLVRKP